MKSKQKPTLNVIAPTFVNGDKEEAIACLEQALDEARAGRVSVVALAVVRPDQSLNTAWSVASGAAIGAVALLQKRMIEAIETDNGV